MALTHVGTSTTASGTGTSATVTYSPVANNLVVVWVRITTTGSSAYTTQTGWNQLTAVSVAGGSRVAAYAKIAGVSETSENPVTWTGSVAWAAILDEYNGPTLPGPLEVQNNAANASANPLTTPTVTPTLTGSEKVVNCCVTSASAITYTAHQVNASATGVTARGAITGSQTFDLIVTLSSGTYQGQATPSAANTLSQAGIALFRGSPVSYGRRVLQAVNRAGTY